MRIKTTLISVCFLLISGLSHAQQCVEDSWEYLGDNTIYEKETGTFRPGVVVSYGVNQEDGVTIRPNCPVLSPAGQRIKIPVFLIDFHDYVPGVDLSNPNNPDSNLLPGYVQQTRQQVSDYLNGPDGPAQFFDDVSGGQLLLEFDVHDWIVSSDTGYLKGRDNYMSFLNNSWRCDRQEMMRDVIRESIATLGVDWTQYDVEANNHANVLKKRRRRSTDLRRPTRTLQRYEHVVALGFLVIKRKHRIRILRLFFRGLSRTRRWHGSEQSTV